ncbi:MAG: DUF1684 domain-containing protein [Candidatus Dormibacteria bacterium]
MGDAGAQNHIDLVDWRRRVGDLYRLASRDGLDAFRSARDDLLRSHPQSPIPPDDRADFGGIDYFPPDPALRFQTRVIPAKVEAEVEIDTGGPDGVIHYRTVGQVPIEVAQHQYRLTLFSIAGYGGGLFLPFRDATSGTETYGGGRYLFDTIKNTDAGALEVTVGSLQVVVDFNYAYNPSCAYNPHWACPLAPRENWLPVPIRAGERAYRPRPAQAVAPV